MVVAMSSTIYQKSLHFIVAFSDQVNVVSMAFIYDPMIL